MTHPYDTVPPTVHPENREGGAMGLSNYPPGVTGNEPELTGIWPCSRCNGEVEWNDEGRPGSSCWFCGGTGVDPEDPPPCPECGSEDTDFDGQLYALVVCAACGETS